MPKGPRGRKCPPDVEKIKELLRVADIKMRQAAEEMLKHLKEPKYPASTITERQKAYNAKYRKEFRAILASLDRRIAKRKGRNS
jgi:hypothetical protein